MRFSFNTGHSRADVSYVMTDQARHTWWQRRLDDLAREIEAGDYFVPAEEIAAAILFGRPKWGDNPDLVADTSRWSLDEASAGLG